MDKTRIHEALCHQKNFMDRTFSDEDLMILMNYWKQVADLTNGIESLKATAVYAIVEGITLQNIKDARGL